MKLLKTIRTLGLILPVTFTGLFSTVFSQNDSLVSVKGLTPYNGDLLKRTVRVVILDISENDLFYPKRRNYIGLTGEVGSARLIRNRPLWYKGSIKLDSGKRKFFEEVKISIEIPPSKSDTAVTGQNEISVGTRVRILGISEADLYYPNWEKLQNKTGVTNSVLVKNGDQWWSGEIKLDDGYICRFHQVKIEPAK